MDSWRKRTRYVHEPLRNESNIRLLNLHPGNYFDQLEITVFETADSVARPSYYALSYVWGSGDRKHMVLCNGKSFSITENLDNALRRIREGNDGKEPSCLWIDAICIDQTNLEERRTQVGLMGQIYREAQYVCAWLGDVIYGVDTGLALTLIQRLEEASRYKGPFDYGEMYSHYVARAPFESLGQNAVQNLQRYLLQRVYYRRVWVRQECALARVLYFRIGKQVWTREYLRAAVRTLDMACKAGYWKGEGLLLGQKITFDDSLYQELRSQISRCLALTGCKPDSWLKVLSSARESQTTDERDLVYGLLQMSTSDYTDAISADYSLSPEKVFTNATRLAIIGERYLDILQMIGGSPPMSSSPSWTLDFGRVRDSFGSSSPVADNDIPNCEDENRDSSQSLRSSWSSDDFQDTWKSHCATNHSTVDMEQHTDFHLLRLKGASLGTVVDVRTPFPDHTNISSFMTILQSMPSCDKKPFLWDNRFNPWRVFNTTMRPGCIGTEDWNSSTHHYFVTSNGDFGVVGWPVKKGDHLALLLGGTTPYILRHAEQFPSNLPSLRTSEGQWRFGRECYVHGIMHGEAMRRIGLTWKYFDLI